MKRTLIITLLLLVAAFSFGQTNSTFNNLDVRNTTKLRGLIYPFGAVATSPINTAVHEIAMINNTTFALCRMDFKEFADSIANYLNPIIGTHWARTGNYLYPINLTDSVGIGTATPIERLDVQNGNINLDTSSATSGQITQNGETIFHTYSSNPNRQNLWIGGSAGNFTTTGTWNLAIGQGALMSSTDCERNLAIGYNSMYSNTSGSMNLSVGRNSLKNNSSGYYNLAIGEGSLEYNTSGQFNLAIGNDALTGNVANHGSLAIGYNAMYWADDRPLGQFTYNTAIGHEAMKGSSTAANNTGQYNTAVGYQALDAMTSGEKNTVFGVGAGGTNTTGSRNVYLGYDVGNAESYATLSDKLVIENSNADSAGALIFGNFATDRLTFNADLVYGKTHWEDLTTSAAQAKIGVNNKPVYDYDSLALKWNATDTTTNYTAHNFQLKHAYAPGTSIYPHVHYWQHSASDTCEWMILLYRWTDIGETRPAYTRVHTNNQTVEPYSSGTLHQIAEFPAIVAGGAHTESSIFDCKLYVWADGVLYTSQIDIHFEQNKPGTYNEYP